MYDVSRELLRADPSPTVGHALYQVGMNLLQIQRRENKEDEETNFKNKYRYLSHLTQQLATRAVVMCSEGVYMGSDISCFQVKYTLH